MHRARISNLLGKITILFVICFFCLPAKAKYGGGTGAPNDPYLIFDANQMNAIGTDSNDWDKCFKLMADIDMSSFTGTSFNIIGYFLSYHDNKPFTGVLDGNGHKISNFTYTSTDSGFIGLFGYVDDPNAEIKNLGLIDPNIDAGTGSQVGSLVGSLRRGTITNCYVEGGSVLGDWWVGGLVGLTEGSTITNAYSTCIVSGNWYVGELVGGNYNVYSTCIVSGNWYVGGLVGGNCYDRMMTRYGTITNCYSTGSVSGTLYVGVLVGLNLGTISNCYSTGSASGRWKVGGLVGLNYGNITNCCSTCVVIGDDDVGGLAGDNVSGTISDCYSIASVTGKYNVGGLVGYNGEYDFLSCGPSTIINSDSSGSVSGDDHVGGLVGCIYKGTIANCYSTGSVSGEGHVGGLIGSSFYGTVTNCYATVAVSGDGSVGGLVGYIYKYTITNCSATGSVLGDEYVGGLVGWNWEGTITNCYSTGSVSGDDYVGGLMGRNCLYLPRVGVCIGTIYNCYSTGSVSGTKDVGGLVGRNYGEVTGSFWDIETSGQDSSDGGTGLPTAQVKMQATFKDAGWDFVGETVNGIEDIWFIPQQDYPHLWWEGMQVPMKLTPRTLNFRSEGNWVKAHLTLPQGFTVADVDSDKPAVLHSFGFQSLSSYVFVNKDKLVEIEAAFERQAVFSLAGDWPDKLTVAGFLSDGNIFLGTSTVRIIHPGLKVIGELAWYWLNADCVHPDFCDGIDMNRDSLVNLLDYALLMNINLEFVTDE